MPGEANTYDSTHPAVTDVVSRPHDNIVLVYGNSNDGVYNALAFQVIRTVRRIQRVVDSFSLADDTTKEFGYFAENGFSADVNSPDDEVFEIDTERANTLTEYGFAVPQDGVYVGLSAGDGSNINGLREGSTDQRSWSAADLQTQGGVLSDLTYVDAPGVSTDAPIPTTAMSPQPTQGVVRIDSRENGSNPFRFAFDNQSGAQVTIDIVGYGQAYDVRPVEDEQTVRKMLAGNGYNRRILNYGGFDNTKPNLPDSWYANRINIEPGELTPGVSR
jgi:hypothetical protein